MTQRPYRVGMARPAQRYIEPTEIYSDLRTGRSTKMPVDFPYTWTPVNGIDGLVEDATRIAENVVKEVTDRGTQVIKEETGKGVVDLINSTQGKAFLKAVEDSARQGVVTEVKKNAPNLLMFAVAGGAIGGALSAKLGKTGTVLAIGLAVWSGYQLMNPAPVAKARK